MLVDCDDLVLPCLAARSIESRLSSCFVVNQTDQMVVFEVLLILQGLNDDLELSRGGYEYFLHEGEFSSLPVAQDNLIGVWFFLNDGIAIQQPQIVLHLKINSLSLKQMLIIRILQAFHPLLASASSCLADLSFNIFVQIQLAVSYLQLLQLFQMSFKASIDIFVNFSYMRVRFLNRQGYLRYRFRIFYEGKQTKGECRPYSIVKGAFQENVYPQETPEDSESKIDSLTQQYYSRLIPVRYRPDDYQQNETVFFKAYINIEEVQNLQFYCQIDCLFSQNPKTGFELVGKFKAQIRRIYGISTYLPITFDAFEGFMICATFHSTIMEFKFDQEEGEESSSSVSKSLEKKCYDFWSYLDLVTNRFNRAEVRKFYEYYRGFLQNEYQVLQNRHQVLSQAVRNSKEVNNSQQKQQEEFKFVKVTRNQELIRWIEANPQNSFSPPSALISSSEEQEKIIDLMLRDFSVVKGHIYKKWMDFSNFIIKHSKFISKHYQHEYQGLCRDRFKNNVFSHKLKGQDWRIAKYTDSGRTSLQNAFTEKKKAIGQLQLWNECFPIQNCEYFGKSQNSVKFFEEISLTNQKLIPTLPQKKSKHIIVLVHGFQASRSDFVLFKNCLEVTYGVQVIISICNEGLTQNSIKVAGRRLGTEVKKILMSASFNYRLSFIGHSMGGLIIRAAIPYLKEISSNFYSFISLSSPHLGYLYQSNTLIRAGLWLLTAIQKCEALLEMGMRDKENLRETTLYELSQNGSLNDFKKICLMCSSLDEYVVYESARIQRNETLMRDTLDSNTQAVIREMVEGMIGSVKAPQISRINVVFDIQDKNLDSFLGRTGHVRFLSDIQFIREFCSCFDQFFV